MSDQQSYTYELLILVGFTYSLAALILEVMLLYCEITDNKLKFRDFSGPNVVLTQSIISIIMLGGHLRYNLF